MAVPTLLHAASLFVGVVSLSVPATALSVRAPMAAQVRVYDNVGLPADELNRALTEAAHLLRTVSVGITWRHCPAEGQQFCSSQMAEGERVIRILNSSGSPESWDGKPLGGAVIDIETASSVLATAYANRTASTAARCGVDPILLLGRVVAHELRHVLSAEPGHGAVGLMREQWTCEELRANRPEDWSFLAADRSAIRKGFGRDTR
jgi:hypothetical protein